MNLLESKIGAPQWADAVWNATSVGGWRGWDDLGDLDTIGLELSWPGNWENQVLFASIVVQDGPFVQEFVVTTIDEYRRVFTPGTPWPVGPDEPPCRADVIRHLEPLEPAEAAGRISHAIDLTEMMIDAPVSDDSYLFVPLARQILSGQPSVAPPDPIEASHDQREQLILEFLNADGVAATLGLEDDPGSSQQIGEFCELFIDYSEGYAGGDIHRWSPMVVEGFLHFYGVKVMSDPDTDELLEPVLTEWIAYCHRLKGWPESVTVEALEVFDQHYECAIDPDAQDAITPMVDLIRLAVEMGIDLEDPISVRELLATWDPVQVGATAEPWPADGAAEMMWDLVPAKAVPHCESVLAMAEPVLDDLFSPDHLTSARRMLADLAERHTQPFLRGRPDVWAASITYAVAQVHSAFDSTGRIFGFDEKLAPQQLVDAFPTVSKASMTNKATTVRAWLNADGSGRFRYNRTAAMLGGVSPRVNGTDFRYRRRPWSRYGGRSARGWGHDQPRRRVRSRQHRGGQDRVGHAHVRRRRGCGVRTGGPAPRMPLRRVSQPARPGPARVAGTRQPDAVGDHRCGAAWRLGADLHLERRPLGGHLSLHLATPLVRRRSQLPAGFRPRRLSRGLTYQLASRW